MTDNVGGNTTPVAGHRRLSSGAISGIAVGVIGGIALATIGAFFLASCRKPKEINESGNNIAVAKPYDREQVGGEQVGGEQTGGEQVGGRLGPESELFGKVARDGLSD